LIFKAVTASSDNWANPIWLSYRGKPDGSQKRESIS
jgi:hypothetical protein